MKYLLSITILLISCSAMAELKFVKHDFSFGSIYIPNKTPKAMVILPNARIISMGFEGEHKYVLAISEEGYFCKYITKQQLRFLFEGKPCNYKQLYLLLRSYENGSFDELYEKLEILLTSTFYFWNGLGNQGSNIDILIEEDRLSSIWRIDNSKVNKKVVYKSVMDNSQLFVEQEIIVEGTHNLLIKDGDYEASSKFRVWFAGLVQSLENNELDIDDLEEFCRLNSIGCFLNENGEIINLTPVRN